jgi:hypothetical protein
MKPKIFSIYLSLVTLLLFHGNGFADPRYILKGTTIISYLFFVEKVVGGEQCKIDDNSFATGLQFVANQSTKLKIINQRDYVRRAEELAQKTRVIEETLDRQIQLWIDAKAWNRRSAEIERARALL